MIFLKVNNSDQNISYQCLAALKFHSITLLVPAVLLVNAPLAPVHSALTKTANAPAKNVNVHRVPVVDCTCC